MQTKQFFVFGEVQGVGFRFFTLQEAGKIVLNGSVRNRIYGSVEVIAQGSKVQLEEIAVWLKHGPKTSEVERVVELDYPTTTIFENFSIIR